MAKKKKSSKKVSAKTGIGLAIWFLLVIFLLVLFIVNQGKIISNLKNTGFFDKTIGKTPAFVENAEVSSDSEKTGKNSKNDVEPISSIQIAVTENSSGNSSTEIISKNEVTKRQTEAVKKEAEKKAEEAKVQAKSENKSEPKTAETKTSSEAQKASSNVSGKDSSTAKTVPQTMNIKLYFMTINSNGNVIRKEVVRSMKKSDSPLVDSINALIAGPTPQEEDAGCRSLISNGTKLIGASVKNGIATLNFSSDFEFNQYGIEGTQGQLQQIVFTATAFQTVNSVQFLVAGEKKSYLGSEGVWIGTPLSRNSF